MEYARTIFCVKLSINNHIVGLVHKNHTRYNANAPYVRRTTQLAKLSFNHSNGCTHSWRFQLFIKCFWQLDDLTTSWCILRSIVPEYAPSEYTSEYILVRIRVVEGLVCVWRLAGLSRMARCVVNGFCRDYPFRGGWLTFVVLIWSDPPRRLPLARRQPLTAILRSFSILSFHPWSRLRHEFYVSPLTCV